MDLILYNPKSKNSKANIQTHKLVRKYKIEKKPFRLKNILKIHDMKKYLEDNKRFENIILLGGDGTINTLVNNVFDYDIKQSFHIKKNGSGNDFLRSLKNKDKNPQYIMENTLDQEETHHFINGTGFGLDGLIIDYVDKAKNKGKLSYFICSIKGMMSYVPEPLEVVIDGQKYNFEKAYMVVINNGRFVGGGMQITPNANIDDEDLDVIIVHGLSKFMLLILFSTIYLGIHTKFTKWVFYKKCKSIKATFTTPQICQSDGEKHEDVTSMEVKSSEKNIHLRAY
ncbi:Putative lipid kinase BmrU [Candidatus Izimaplasma bacterium HR1]|jgi:diacylglycerol kinase family enzyme|uniref:diacylglycerol/lipid kinase family protein n=1 Tax=Candidatus Izimoplasma sp. HR1 TaxID=1541959 RepID=UPI0004F8AE97|nr:Putative lipid kinase BmrU [Candidatus Izimaplasma bacterium HR1]